MRFLICDAELAALDGLPLLARCVYCFGIRPYMDYSTGIVGLARGISYQSIREALYVEPEPGRHKSGSPTKKQIRNAVDSLVRAGLLEQLGSDRRLVFRLTAAERDTSARNRMGTGRAQGNGTPATARKRPAARAQHQEAMEHGHSGCAEHGHTSGIREPVERSQPQQRTVVSGQVAPGGGGDLIFPEQLDQADRTKAARLVAGLNGEAQALLDELAGRMRAGNVANPVGYLRGLVKAAKAGEFVPELADQVRKARQAAARHQAALQRPPELPAPTRKRRKAAPAELREALRKKRPPEAAQE